MRSHVFQAEFQLESDKHANSLNKNCLGEVPLNLKFHASYEGNLGEFKSENIPVPSVSGSVLEQCIICCVICCTSAYLSISAIGNIIAVTNHQPCLTASSSFFQSRTKTVHRLCMLMKTCVKQLLVQNALVACQGGKDTTGKDSNNNTHQKRSIQVHSARCCFHI